MKHLNNFKSHSITEDTSATGGPAGAVTGGSVGSISTTSQPASLPGVTADPAYSNNGGQEGSYISTPYNATGGKTIYNKTPSKSKEHSSRKSPKSRASVARAALKNMTFNKKQDYTSGEGKVKKPKVMNFSDFEKKSNITSVKK